MRIPITTELNTNSGFRNSVLPAEEFHSLLGNKLYKLQLECLPFRNQRKPSKWVGRQAGVRECYERAFNTYLEKLVSSFINNHALKET